MSEGSEFAANTGMGVVFRRFFFDSSGLVDPERKTSDIQLDFSINVASTVDTIIAEYANGSLVNARDFGTQVLLPTNSGQAFKLSYYQYFNPSKCEIFKWLSGVNFNIAASNRVWQDSIMARNVTTFSLRTGVFHDFIPNNMRLENDYAIRVGGAFTYRSILGDASFGEVDVNEFRERLLGTIQRNYAGFELFGELKFNNLVFSVSLPMILGSQRVPGLSRAQFVTSVGFVGGFPLKLEKAKPKI